jgi:hypothetical protein
MPFRDGKGPHGTGPVGWGMGPCRRGSRGGRGFWVCRPDYADPKKIDDKEFLQQEKEILEKEIEMIKKRLKELETEK